MNSKLKRVAAGATAAIMVGTSACGLDTKLEDVRQKELVDTFEEDTLIDTIYSEESDELNRKLFELENAILKYRFVDSTGLGYLKDRASDLDDEVKQELDAYNLDGITSLYNEFNETNNEHLENKLAYVLNSSRATINDNLDVLASVLYRDAKLKIGDEVNNIYDNTYINEVNYNTIVHIGKNNNDNKNVYKYIIITNDGSLEYTIPKGNNAAYDMFKMAEKIKVASNNKVEDTFAKKLRLARLGFAVLKMFDSSTISIDANGIITTTAPMKLKDYLDNKNDKELTK